MGVMDEHLAAAGFNDVNVEVKPESREVIKQWMPGSGAEDFVVSAAITATKPPAMPPVQAYMVKCADKPAVQEDSDDDAKPTLDESDEEPAAGGS